MLGIYVRYQRHLWHAIFPSTSSFLASPVYPSLGLRSNDQAIESSLTNYL